MVIELKMVKNKDNLELFANIYHEYEFNDKHKRSFSIGLNKDEFISLKEQINKVRID